MYRVLVDGVGQTPFGRQPEPSGRELFAAAAFEDATVPRADVEELYYSNFIGEIVERQGYQGPLMAEAAGVSGVPAT